MVLGPAASILTGGYDSQVLIFSFVRVSGIWVFLFFLSKSRTIDFFDIPLITLKPPRAVCDKAVQALRVQLTAMVGRRGGILVGGLSD